MVCLRVEVKKNLDFTLFLTLKNMMSKLVGMYKGSHMWTVQSQ